MQYENADLCSFYGAELSGFYEAVFPEEECESVRFSSGGGKYGGISFNDRGSEL